MKTFKKILLWFVITLVGVLTGFFIYVRFFLSPHKPEPADTSSLQWDRVEPDSGLYKVKNSWLKKSKSGLWELYVEGKPYERGVAAGKLSYELQQYQEEVFVSQIREIVPSKFYMRFLGYLIRWFNRNLEKNVSEENKLEIAGYSDVMPKDYEYFAPNYERILNYHAAHDIGHALQQYALVGCTSFSARDARTNDSSMIIGRNFDFYVGDHFADNKIVMFFNPDSGYKFMSVAWAGMFGCVSGMNEKGLTVTINAAKSDMPSASAMPISLLVREILQYASNIDEAVAIAGKRKTFVSEIIMVGSATDHTTALIEKSPSAIGVIRADSAVQVCSNHYQSETYKNDSNNISNMKESASVYRYQRLQQLLAENTNEVLDPARVAAILRDKKGINGVAIGYGNEKAMDQMLGHHSVIFKPEQRLVWVSTFPWQEGKYVCYDLNKFFSEQYRLNSNREITVDSLEIPADPFMQSPEFKGYLAFRDTTVKIKAVISGKAKEPLAANALDNFIQSNPSYYYTYALAGDYEKKLNHKDKAAAYYKKALTLEINTVQEKDKLEKSLKEVTE